MLDWQSISPLLNAKLDPKHVKPPSKFGPKGDYIEGWFAIAEANRIFGFGGWSYSVRECRCVSEAPREIGQYKKQGFGVTYIARVVVEVGTVARDDVGSGHGYDADLGLAHESAIKEAVTDALKRALRTFGNPFGLALYDKTRANVGVDAPAPHSPSQRLADAISARERPAEPPHDPQTGEILDARNGAPQGETEEAMPPSVATFIDQVKEHLAMNGCEKPTRDQLEHGYAMAVIENIAKRKSSAKAKQWFGIFCDLHAKAIGRIQDEGLKSQVRSAIALKQAMIDGENPDPADYGHPFGAQEPIVLGEIPVVA